MEVAIIGSGNVGSALAKALRRGRHTVKFGARAPKPDRTDETTIGEAIDSADVTILAIPFAAVPDVIAAGGGFVGKVLIDATNPIGKTAYGPGLTTGFQSSGAEAIAAQAPGAKVFKTFNQTGFENMEDATVFKTPPVMFVAGDDAVSKPLVLQLVSDAGFEAVDAGKLHAARLLEPLAMLWIEQGRFRGMGPDFAFTLQRKV